MNKDKPDGYVTIFTFQEIENYAVGEVDLWVPCIILSHFIHHDEDFEIDVMTAIHEAHGGGGSPEGPQVEAIRLYYERLRDIVGEMLQAEGYHHVIMDLLKTHVPEEAEIRRGSNDLYITWRKINASYHSLSNYTASAML